MKQNSTAIPSLTDSALEAAQNKLEVRKKLKKICGLRVIYKFHSCRKFKISRPFVKRFSDQYSISVKTSNKHLVKTQS